MEAEGNSIGRRPLILIWAVFAVLFAANYVPTFRWMIMRWNEDGSYSSHGWLIPPVSAVLLWGMRDRLGAVPRQSSAAGFGMVLLALCIHALSGAADVSSLSGFSMVLLVAGFSMMMMGSAWFRVAWFPILLLLFMVPLPDFLISNLNFKLKLVAADVAARMLNASGLPAIHAGSFLLFGEEKLAVGDVCSGLRSMLSLVALGTIYAWLVRDRGRLLVLAILLAIIPSAVFGNGLRIYIVSLLVYFLGSETVFRPIVAGTDLHLLTGGIIFLGAFAVLYAISSAYDAFMATRSSKSQAGEKAALP
ncbi:MAG TPA: exosortase/archaeosortase family protein [Fibrobacteria bacterium]|nr:exosortase/archaeosortase family protein [Fibrobacteria bacterium]